MKERQREGQEGSEWKQKRREEMGVKSRARGLSKGKYREKKR